MGLKSWAFLVLILAVMGSFWNSQKTPNGHKNPTKLKFLFSAARIFHFVSHFVQEKLGFADFHIHALKFVSNMTEIRVEDLPQDGVKVTNQSYNDIEVLVYTPEGVTSQKAVFFVHGGGWLIGTFGMYDMMMRQLASDLGFITVVTSYRKAPVYKYPEPLNDVIASFKGMVEQASTLGVDPKQIIVAGDSAGGNLVAAMLLKLRDEKYSPMPELQVLLYPALQMIDPYTPSYQDNWDDAWMPHYLVYMGYLYYAFGDMADYKYVMNNRHVEKSTKFWLQTHYLKHDDLPGLIFPKNYKKPVAKGGRLKTWEKLKPIFMDPYFSPLMAEDLSNLPKTLVVTVKQDVLTADGCWYSSRLLEAGNEVKHVHYLAGFHGMLINPDTELNALVADYIKQSLGIIKQVKRALKRHVVR